MALNRLSRDMIISEALNMIDSPALDHKDRPGGILQPNAMSITWLQEGLDYIQRNYPIGGQITNDDWVLSSGAITTTVPDNYLIDFENGIMITSPTHVRRRLIRTPMDTMMNYNLRNTGSTGTPSRYTITGTSITYDITAKETYTGIFKYYKLAAPMQPDTVPTFPDDFMLVEYVRLRGLEWQGQAEKGAAMTYAYGLIGRLTASGLAQEAQRTSFPLDPTIFHPSGNTQYGGSAWLGDSVPR